MYMYIYVCVCGGGGGAIGGARSTMAAETRMLSSTWGCHCLNDQCSVPQ